MKLEYSIKKNLFTIIIPYLIKQHITFITTPFEIIIPSENNKLTPKQIHYLTIKQDFYFHHQYLRLTFVNLSKQKK